MFKGRQVAVTGGNGFVGSHLVERLVAREAKVRVIGMNAPSDNLKAVSDKIEYRRADLTDADACAAALGGAELVFHLASRVGGIQYNLAHPAVMFAPNAKMSLNVLESCAKSASLERLLLVSSTCVYRRFCTIPSPEEEGFIEDPEPSNIGYGWAKRVAEKAAMLYAKEFGLKVGIVRPENIYGPRDNFSPEYAHVIPSMIRRAMDSKDELIIWGSGKQTRSFLYVEDAVDGMLVAMEKHPVPDPINLGSAQETTIMKVAEMILDALGKSSVRIMTDISKPEGQPRKAADTRKMKSILGFQAKFTLQEGLRRTLDWVQSNPWCL